MASRIRLFRPAQARRAQGLDLAFLAAYAVCALLAYTWTTSVNGLAVLWICNGLLAAGLLLLPRQQALVLALLCTTIDLLAALNSGSPLGRGLLIAGCDLAEAVLAAVLIRRVCGAGLDMNVLPRFRNFVLLAALPATVTLGTLGACLAALMFKDNFLTAWKTWVFGDFLGMIVGAPAALLLARFRRYDAGAAASRFEIFGLIGLALAAAALVFSSPLPALFLLFPLGLLVVIRLSSPYTALMVMLVSFIAASATVAGHGPIAAQFPGDMPRQILVLQLYLATIVSSAIILSSVLAQRAAAQAGLRRALAVARAARRDAVAADGAKGRFLAVMSHEMRTPLNGIKGHAQLLAARADLAPPARDQIGVIQASCQVLLSLISNILDYSRTGSGAARLSHAPLALAALVQTAGDIVRPSLGNRPLTLSVDLSAVEGLRHVGDENHILQVLLNLLGNAVKFTDHGRIEVRVDLAPRADVDRVRVSVRDTGVGLSPEALPLLFQPFTQADTSATRRFDGAGLGLAISKSLVEQMGGEIGVESVLGQGSEFWFEIPLSRLEAPLHAATAESQGVGTGRILVVDDHPVNRQVASMMLAAAGFDVETADDGAQAVEAVRSRSFDVVFMDIHMPVMDGLTACRAIRALEGDGADTPVVAMTAATLPEDVARCHAAGMDAHLPKPVEQERLVAAALHPWRAADGPQWPDTATA